MERKERRGERELTRRGQTVLGQLFQAPKQDAAVSFVTVRGSERSTCNVNITSLLFLFLTDNN